VHPSSLHACMMMMMTYIDTEDIFLSAYTRLKHLRTYIQHRRDQRGTESCHSRHCMVRKMRITFEHARACMWMHLYMILDRACACIRMHVYTTCTYKRFVHVQSSLVQVKPSDSHAHQHKQKIVHTYTHTCIHTYKYIHIRTYGRVHT
jgi:hypothetical protein